MIGVNYPLNSVGLLPTKYLDNSENYKARALLANARQILEQYIVKEKIKQRTELLFQPYAPLLGHEAIVGNIERLIETEQYGSAQSASIELLDDCLNGLRYYQTYDWLFLRSVISAGYAGWIVYSLLFIAKEYSNVVSEDKKGGGIDWIVNGGAIVVSIGFSLLLGYKESPVFYYAYIAFPIFFWWYAASQRVFIAEIFGAIIRDPKWLNGLGYTLAYVASLEVLVGYSWF